MLRFLLLPGKLLHDRGKWEIRFGTKQWRNAIIADTATQRFTNVCSRAMRSEGSESSDIHLQFNSKKNLWQENWRETQKSFCTFRTLMHLRKVHRTTWWRPLNQYAPPNPVQRGFKIWVSADGTNGYIQISLLTEVPYCNFSKEGCEYIGDLIKHILHWASFWSSMWFLLKRRDQGEKGLGAKDVKKLAGGNYYIDIEALRWLVMLWKGEVTSTARGKVCNLHY